jgi:AraC-like DNA-binding protein
MVLMPNIMPHIALRPYVSHYLLLHVHLKGVPAHERIKPIPPDADQSLFFYPRSEVKVILNSTSESRTSASSVFVAQQTSRINIQFGDDHLIVQVCFRAGFMHQLLGKLPLSELQGKELNAEDVSDSEMRILNEKLRETNDYFTMIDLIERYLLRRIGQMKPEVQPIDKIIACIKDAQKPLSLDWLADQACLSTRQFERKFQDRMGMSPKFYTRIARFDKAFKIKAKHPQLEWLDVAYHCGYFDFSHLMRDFRQFAEVTPSLLIAQNENSPDRKIIV